MRPERSEAELLRALAAMPFMDRLEMVAVSGYSRGMVYEVMRRLEDEALAASVPHAADLVPPTRRYFITGAGIGSLAEVEDAGVDEMLHRHPTSVQWLRVLMERLDALAVIYRLAAAVSNVAHPIRLRLYRAMPMDAAIELSGGRTVGVVRQGLTADRSAFSKRILRLSEGPVPGAVLLLMPDEVRLRHARRLLIRTRLHALLALERDAALAGPGDRIWRPAAVHATLDLRYVLRRLEPAGELPAEAPLSKTTMPGDGAPDAVRALPALLKPGEKRTLDLISDWPWIERTELASLLNVSEPRASQLTTPLEGFGLVTRPIAGSERLALTDRGLALLARRDRASVGLARKRWSVAPIDDKAPLGWRNVSGGRSRQLLRNIEHTQAVHAFVAALARQADSLGWDLEQIDPPRRASRHFRHEEGMRSVNPDAFGILHRGPVTWPFFLEWERRAVRPATMATRLAPYLRYYSTRRPTDDHGVQGPPFWSSSTTTSPPPTS